ncbi:MAG: hypothetical protein AAFR11_00340 [Pseudomonadota bacterium]
MIKRFAKPVRFAALAVAASALAACATEYPGNSYGPSEVGVASDIYRGRLLAVQPANVRSSEPGSGVAAGALAGGAVGAVAGARSDNSAPLALVGAVVGGVLGAATEQNAARSGPGGFRYLIELRDGRTIGVVQADPRPVAAPGQEVLVEYGSRVRVTAAY